ncbi:hypothetical protein SCHPADRAFT_336229 [Schizopora paradoxa]|uniref:SHSP domain-containing protein n=1 Tax=Schizopora paradoxa TaxID=27342 RepID=A0A0H2RQ00_9AGAM|nr:hypothetical protein SCHPADRAFT_336229 [Schizopora paradoxa]
MSYPYPYIDHYSPSPTAFTQWDITQESANVNAQQHIHHHQQAQQQEQQHHQQEPEGTTPTSAASTPAGYEAPQVIQLTERVPRRRVRIQNPEAVAAAAATGSKASQSPSTPLRSLHPLQQATPPTMDNNNNVKQQQQQQHGKHHQRQEQQESEGGGAGSPVRQLNTSRTQARLASHPYHRRVVSAGEPSSRGKRILDAEQATSPTSTGLLGAAQIVMACGGTKGRNRSPSQASAGSPSTTSPTQAFPPSGDASPPVRRMLIRTDLHQSSETNGLTAMLELPGVKKSDIRVALNVDPFSGIKQLTVTGRSALRFPHEREGWYLVRERKYGEFKRVLVVPPDTKAENIEASMEDGILYLRYPGAAPPPDDERASLPPEEPTIITVV